LADDSPPTAPFHDAGGAVLAVSVDEIGEGLGTRDGRFVLATVIPEMVEGHPVDIAIELPTMLDLACFQLLQGGHDRILEEIRRELGVACHARELRLETGHVPKEHLLIRAFLAGARIG
jgi:hypothetical protein